MFEFDKGKKHNCPSCGQKTFVRLIDKKTGALLPENYGKCDRYDKCGYKKYPKFVDKSTLDFNKNSIKLHELFCDKDFSNNLFYNELCKLYGSQKVDSVFNLYKVFNIKYLNSQNDLRKKYSNSMVFPFIQSLEPLRISYTQIIKYSGISRDKVIPPTSLVSLAKLELNGKKEYEAFKAFFDAYDKKEVKRECFFGSHIFDKNHEKIDTVYIVEAPKTAIIATLHYGDYQHNRCLFLASGGATLVNENFVKKYMNKNICLIPDCGLNKEILNSWHRLQYLNNYTNSRLTIYEIEGDKGYDLADAILDDNPPALPFMQKTQKIKITTLFENKVQKEPQNTDNEQVIDKPTHDKPSESPLYIDKDGFLIDKNFENYLETSNMPPTEAFRWRMWNKAFQISRKIEDEPIRIEGIWLDNGTLILDKFDFLRDCLKSIQEEPFMEAIENSFKNLVEYSKMYNFAR